MKTCIACGMPMEEPADFAIGDTRKDYCVFCARPDGTMQSYEEKLASFSDFLIRTQGLDRQVAVTMARNMMAKLPAWQAEAQ